MLNYLLYDLIKLRVFTIDIIQLNENGYVLSYYGV